MNKRGGLKMYKNRILPLLKVLSVVLLPIFSFNLYSSRRGTGPRKRVVVRRSAERTPRRAKSERAKWGDRTKESNVTITLVVRNITNPGSPINPEEEFVIVNAANYKLKKGGGISQAVFNAAGSRELQRECNEIVRRKGQNIRGARGLPTSSVHATGSYNLVQRGITHILHAVSPNFNRRHPYYRYEGAVFEQGGEKLLFDTYQNALFLAEQLGVTGIAFPFLSGGHFRGNVPWHELTRVACEAIIDFCRHHNPQHISEIRFVLFTEQTLWGFKDALKGLTGRDMETFEVKETSVAKKKREPVRKKRESVRTSRPESRRIVRRKKKREPVRRRRTGLGSRTRRASSTRRPASRRRRKKQSVDRYSSDFDYASHTLKIFDLSDGSDEPIATINNVSISGEAEDYHKMEEDRPLYRIGFEVVGSHLIATVHCGEEDGSKLKIFNLESTRRPISLHPVYTRDGVRGFYVKRGLVYVLLVGEDAIWGPYNRRRGPVFNLNRRAGARARK